ncbi:hypothetical protein ElyMa_005523000 [Elysia marginata]|uniref:Uncharacterized protein n=1 Tax=Elysia marginata TaxID=1093978 RepID=A0AAV4EWJ2_9GAST|nr:hypothetical protein ElyMa_005523000 [Elysia marginata]
MHYGARERANSTSTTSSTGDDEYQQQGGDNPSGVDGNTTISCWQPAMPNTFTLHLESISFTLLLFPLPSPCQIVSRFHHNNSPVFSLNIQTASRLTTSYSHI